MRRAAVAALTIVASPFAFASSAAALHDSSHRTRATAAATASPMPLISRGVPAFASSQLYPAASANDGDYDTTWRGSIPGWLAYNLSGIPAAQRSQVIVGWYNDPATTPYDHTIVGDNAYNNLRDYTIQGNPAATAASAPTTGWVTLVTVTGNRYHSRQHLVDLTGYNWIRINVTAGDGSSGNGDASINLDVHDASQGVRDSWIFYGDSITEDGLHHAKESSTGNFSQLINAAKPSYYPAYDDGGTWGLTSTDGAQYIRTWLNAFPGTYVALNYGTNDANGCTSTTTFYNNYVAMVQAVLDAGKVPIVPTIPWARTANLQNCGPGFNAKIQALYTAFPQIVKGPDLWAYFQSHQTLIGGDNLHPSSAGYVAYRQQWANAMLAALYADSGTAPALTLAPTALSYPGQRVGTTSAAQTTTLTNSGTQALSITGISVGGANASDFSQTNDCPLAPATLAPSASCAISASFRPTAGGARTATVSITHNAAGSPRVVTLNGTGTLPAVTLSPSSIAFSATPVGASSAARTSVLRNAGTAPLTISAIRVVGVNPGDYAQSNDCTTTLTAGASCTISATFTPTATGARSAGIEIADDAGDSPQTLALTGTGSAPAPIATVAPTSLSFAAQRVGTVSGGQTATIRNTGTAPMTISGIAITGTDQADFAETSDCPVGPATLAVDASCSVRVTFAPSSAGIRRAQVTISDDAPDTPQTIALDGTGNASTIAFDRNLGSRSENIGGAKMTFTTGAAASPRSRVFVFVNWNHASRTLASVAGGGLAWTVDVQARDSSNRRGAIASAYAPSGLAAGTVVTAKFSGPVGHGLIAGASFSGIASVSPVDATGANAQAGVTDWSATLTTSNATDLVLGWSGINANATSSTPSPTLEIHDFGNGDYGEWATSVYAIESASGVMTINGVWSGATGSTANMTVLAAYRGS